MSKKFANESPKKQKDPVATYLPPGFTVQEHRGLADEGTLGMSEFGRDEAAKQARAAKPTKVADAEHHAGDGGKARPRVAS